MLRAKRIIKLEKLYLLNITTLNKKIIHIGINQDASPKITNNNELRFEPNKPKAFKGGSSLTVKNEDQTHYKYIEI